MSLRNVVKQEHQQPSQQQRCEAAHVINHALLYALCAVEMYKVPLLIIGGLRIRNGLY